MKNYKLEREVKKQSSLGEVHLVHKGPRRTCGTIEEEEEEEEEEKKKKKEAEEEKKKKKKKKK
jgi:hypothetical protein